MNVDLTKLPGDVRRKIELYWGSKLGEDLSVERAFQAWWQIRGTPTWQEAYRALDAIRAASGQNADGELGQWLDKLPVDWLLTRVDYSERPWQVEHRGCTTCIGGRTPKEALRAALH